MRSTRRIVVVLVSLMLLTAVALPVFAAGAREEVPYIAVVSKGEQHDFWQTVRMGAEAAAEEYGVDMTFEGPPSESDIQIQVEMLNSALARGPVALALAALDTGSVLDQLAEARQRGIPVVGFDSGVPEAPEGSIVADASTDNYAAAGMAAEIMFEELKDKISAASSANPVRLVVMNQDASGESLLSRGRGFRDYMVNVIVDNTDLTRSDIRVTGNPAYIADDSPTGGDKVFIEMVVPASADEQDATSSAHAILNRVDGDNIIGLFCSNEATVKGLLAATDDGTTLGSRYEDLVVIGFDAGAAQKNAVREGFFLGSITQDPYMIGYYSVELAYKAYRGETVEDIDTGAQFYNAGNMDDPDIARLLYD